MRRCRSLEYPKQVQAESMSRTPIVEAAPRCARPAGREAARADWRAEAIEVACACELRSTNAASGMAGRIAYAEMRHAVVAVVSSTHHGPATRVRERARPESSSRSGRCAVTSVAGPLSSGNISNAAAPINRIPKLKAHTVMARALAVVPAGVRAARVEISSAAAQSAWSVAERGAPWPCSTTERSAADATTPPTSNTRVETTTILATGSWKTTPSATRVRSAAAQRAAA
mmetsp:Transcript_30732/g.76877  ORF Transcript_30732/g.76877 Transcript_30732/m.76877 type:complete len:230 (+) Transcript_30732:431-1120(+)